MRSTASLYKATHAGLSKFAMLWLRGLVAVSGMALLGIVSILLGLNTPAETSPLVIFLRGHPLAALLSGVFFLTITGASLLIIRVPGAGGDRNGPHLPAGGHLATLLAATSVATGTTVLFASLLGTVLTRPTWCPTMLCPTPQAVTNPQGTHDPNLEMFVTAVQSAYYAIPEDPARYSLSNLPKSVGALNVGRAAATTSPYRVAIGVHSLQRGQYGMVIEQVAMIVRAVPPLPYPLNVWQAGEPRSYQTNLYQALYFGQQAGAALSAAYQKVPGGMVQLAPGESDEIDLQIVSLVAADLRFQIQVTYRVANESAIHTLTLPQVFEVAFSGPSDWHVYQLQGGHFVTGGR